jgi:putative endonuclease
MTDQRRTTGRRGEALAAKYLRAQGYGIIAANWRCRHGELDLVAVDGSTLVFVEVRTRRSAVLGLAEGSITLRKRRRLQLLAAEYLQQREAAADPWQGPWRIDVVAVRLNTHEHSQIQHLPFAVEEC